MAIGRVGLVIADEFCANTLSQILTDADFDVDSLTIDISRMHNSSVLDSYDLVILNNDIAHGQEEGVFSLILSVRGFLLIDAARNIADFSDSSARYINLNMSPEEIVSRVNSVLFQHKNIRKSPRISVNFNVEYYFEGACFRSSVQNLSQNGVFIATLNPPDRNALITAHFTLPGGSSAIKAVGRVLYSIGYDLDLGIISHPSAADRKIIAMPGMGIFFETISDEDREAIRIFIEEKVF